MKKVHLLFTFLVCTVLLNAQTVATFENISLAANSYRNGKDSLDRMNHGFSSGKLFLRNNYDTSFGGFWSGGFAISNKTNFAIDSTTADFTKMYNSVTGTAANGTSNYAIGQIGATIVLSDTSEQYPESVYITNSNYSYLAMKWGDGFAREYGDSDFLNLYIAGFKNGMPKASVIEVKLAQGKNLLNTWQMVSLTALGKCDSIIFGMNSSDTGSFGINTPTFFCMDEFKTSNGNTGLRESKGNIEFSMYPNPSSDFVSVEVAHVGVALAATPPLQISILDLSGKEVLHTQNSSIDIHSLETGCYFVRVETTDGIATKKLIKQ